MKIFNKFIWSKKEPSNKNDIWFDGSTWRMYTEEAWQSFTLPVDAADKVAKVLENASEVYQEKLNAGYGIVIEGNTISLDVSSIDVNTTHNIGSIELFEQIIAERRDYNLTQEDKDAILNGKIITTSAGNGVVPAISSNSMGENGVVLLFHFNERLYEMFVMWTDTLCYINGVFSFTKEAKLYADSELSETSENSVQNKVVTEKLTELSAETNLVYGEFAISSGSRLSKGVSCPTGNIVVRLALADGSDNSTWTIYRNTNGTFNSQALASGLTFGDYVEVEVPEGDTGIWLFTSSNYTSARTFSYAIGKGLAGEVVKVKDVIDNAATHGYLDVPFSFSELVNNIGGFSKTNLWKRTDFFPAIAGTRISCFDTSTGGRGLYFYSKVKTPISYYKFPSEGYQDIILKSEDIPIDAYYAVAAGDGKAYYRVWMPMQEIAEQSNVAVVSLKGLQEDMAAVTGKIADYSLLSTSGQIKMYVDETPKEEEYYLQLDCETPHTESFGVYKCAEDHSGIESIAIASFGQPLKVTRDVNKPSLYFYAASDASVVEAYTIRLTFKAVTSLADEINAVVESNSWKNKTIVCFGDSLTENQDHDNKKAYADYIHDIMGADVYNIGIGGTQFRQRVIPVETPTTSNQAYAALDIINMVKACCEQNFNKQIAATNYLTASKLDSNDAIIARMQTIDWSKVDVVTIFAGTNDWNNGSDSWGEPLKENTDINTTFGAINEIVRLLLTTYPHLVIYWFTPTVRWIASSLAERTDDTWSDNFKRNNTTLKEFSADVEDLVKLHHIPICDMYNTLGWNQYNFSQYFTDNDGTHPRKGKGTEQIARKMVAFINANRTF